MRQCGRTTRRRTQQRGVGKIKALRGQARSDLGVAAECALAAFGREPTDDDDSDARAYVGAILLIEALAELNVIRRMLTPKE